MSRSMTRVGARVSGTRPYITILGWLVAALGSVRLLSYLPTILAIHASGDSSQHSLWTWVLWSGSNLTMAAWLYEQGGQRLNRAVAVNIGNALMCLGTTAVIVWQRL